MAEPTYLDLAIKRQAILERVKSGQVADFAAEIKAVERLIRQTLGGLESEVSELSRTRLNEFLAQLQRDQAAIFVVASETFTSSLADIAAISMAQEIIDLERTVDVRGTLLDDFTKKDIWSRVRVRPMTTDGQLLEPWLKDFSRNEVRRVNNAIRSGAARGVTNRELVRSIIGTKSKNYQNGIMQISRRNASTVVRTSVQHVASAARHETWQANRDVIDRYKWVSTLDSVTSNICRTLDGQEYEFGEGPLPPVHPNCRSTTIPILDKKYDFLGKSRTRSAEDGPTSANVSYYDWLLKQPASVQDEVLGKTRGKLFRGGGMSAERFRALQFDRNFKPLTLEEMRDRAPEAFRRAGLAA